MPKFARGRAETAYGGATEHNKNPKVCTALFAMTGHDSQ